MIARSPAVAICAALVAGCATLNAPFSNHLASPAPQIRECAEWYRALDEHVAAAGVRGGVPGSV